MTAPDRPRFRGERGITLVEVVVAIGLLAGVFAAFLPVVHTAGKGVGPLRSQAESVDALRNAFAQIGRDLRSAECIAEPGPNAAPGDVLRFSTHTGNRFFEVTYTVADGQLRRRETADPPAPAQVMVDSLVGGTAPAFTHVATPRRSVLVQLSARSHPDRPVRDLGTVIAGRNTWGHC